jgi:glycosyltransferase involved in cell wall biosynthesis
LTSHLPEHLTPEEFKYFLKKCRKMIKPDGLMRLAVPVAQFLFKKYQASELGYFDETNIECRGAKTQLDKLATLLFGGHKAIYDYETMKTRLEEMGFETSRCDFNKSTRPDLMNQIFDYHPDLSFYCEATPTAIPASKLKIAVISTPFITSPPATYGGLELVVANLAKGLSEMGNDVTLFAAKGSKPIGPYKVFETVEPLLNYGTDWGKVDWYKAEKAHYDTFSHLLKDFDIIHGHGWFGFEYMAKRSNPKLHVIHTGHGHLNTWKTKPVENMNLVAISKAMQEEYRLQGFTSKVTYNGIDLKIYPFKKEKGDRLIFLGRFVSFKQPHVAIEVAHRLNMGLDLVGGAYEEPYFSQQITPQCDVVFRYTSDCINLDGSQSKTEYPHDVMVKEPGKPLPENPIILHIEASHEAKIRLLQDAKALLFPSNMKEPFGLVACESMACGTPVIALRDGAIPEIVLDGVTGYVVDSIGEMASRVQSINTISPEACREHVEKNFSIETMAKRYLELYAEKEW